MQQKPFIAIQKINTIPNRRNVQRVTPKDPDSLSDENVDVRMMKRCQRKMSQTISSFHLRVPNYEKFQYHFSLKVSLHSIIKSICNSRHISNNVNRCMIKDSTNQVMKI